ncbi:hypothetical protein AJ85_21665 [Alkalihalobacillus alcalophilus ATCC 27647 = CGMCC 1.3604]|uniref:Alcohol dehydrogenase-like N-terminal domain-containing protein n=1 Tax=Alkalihalobacillus alcalophilus ATCC 27647 = CGMCC 1.3604 TaxID=1218173 RepID=A0A4S4K4N7_ALKAL|nr:alcohol dehydrogenase catalytic domain-containing protein [Alkalihalobacillus alcalophilus]MED1563607.1 hypothetical protein [Alkalihalobacillus alcalophilus]THG91997.1 hypothetical protein AJ85_21665 [Alkalihalobacillus alcalophilus ATCC 27647 = CGMCC 1.3604]
MKTVVAINPNVKNPKKCTDLGEVDFGEVKIRFGLVEFEQPNFDINDSNNDEYLLVKIKAFSCNFRDKAILLESYLKMKHSDRLFLPFGSEFSAEVVFTGKKVMNFRVGDKVMPNCSYPYSGKKGILPGVATNFASIGWLRIHKNKVIKIPRSINEIEAACFSLSAQTATGMIRRSGILDKGGTPLILSARSNTSLNKV